LKARVLKRLFELAPTQEKKIRRFFEREPQAEHDLDAFLALYEPFMRLNGISPEGLAEAYQTMVAQMLHARLAFLRTGQYPVDEQSEALREVYNDSQVMRGYMLGVALSQFLWEHHWRMYKLYQEELPKLPRQGRVLEVGCGHGLFLLAMLEARGKEAAIEAVDISATSIELAQGVLAAVRPDLASAVTFSHADLFDFKGAGGYSFITMGEVLEHVERPGQMLSRIHQLLASGGKAYVSTCANCPAIDHVFHFHTVDEIRALMRSAGFSIERELVAPSEDRSPEALERMKIDISYAAILKKEG
jgi:2-polyprenyl-3-methyl-5-hydroxy-6-metoxy-1,4-benzoquinol methylase